MLSQEHGFPLRFLIWKPIEIEGHHMKLKGFQSKWSKAYGVLGKLLNFTVFEQKAESALGGPWLAIRPLSIRKRRDKYAKWMRRRQNTYCVWDMIGRNVQNMHAKSMGKKKHMIGLHYWQKSARAPSRTKDCLGSVSHKRMRWFCYSHKKVLGLRYSQKSA